MCEMSRLDRIFLFKVFSGQRKISEQLTIQSKVAHGLIKRKEKNFLLSLKRLSFILNMISNGIKDELIEKIPLIRLLYILRFKKIV